MDGEDLASLLRRIGRFSADKAVEIARQICAGLAAAHDRGVVHRDLKPANVMIDGRGKVRITDFGLAGLATEIREGEARVGTPAYMAPEQLAGKEVTTRSDIYSLGLVLYEMFTGKPPFRRGTLEEMRRDREEATPASPSSLVAGLEPAVERAILRCLEKDPKSRPASALAVAASLPGGDPLAAALAAGETPAPEVVAAAGEEGALRPVVAWACLAWTLLGLVVLLLTADRFVLVGRVPLEKPPVVLADRSRDLLAKMGQTAPAADWAQGFGVDEEYLLYVKDHDPSPNRWDRLSAGLPSAIYYWYRQSPQPMIARPGLTVVSQSDPPQVVAGMASLQLDGRGRLIRYEAVPPQVDASADPRKEPDWSALFAEAAAYRGRPVLFRIVGPWSRPERSEPAQLTPGQRIANDIGLSIGLSALAGALVLAWRNLKLNRGDRSGALKIAGFFLVVHLIVWAGWAHHVASLGDEWQIFVMDTGYTLFNAALVWLLYMGLEPFVRRRWPDAIISWARLLSGRFRDPRIGRDILVGCATGVGILCADLLATQTAVWLGWPPPRPENGTIGSLVGLRWCRGYLLDVPVHAVLTGMEVLFALLLLRILVRFQWLATGLLAVLLVAQPVFQSDYPSLELIFLGPLVLLLALVLVRFGLLSGIVVLVFLNLSSMVLTHRLPAWYAGGTILSLLASAALAVYAFAISLGGHPLFSRRLFEEA